MSLEKKKQAVKKGQSTIADKAKDMTKLQQSQEEFLKWLEESNTNTMGYGPYQYKKIR